MGCGLVVFLEEVVFALRVFAELQSLLQDCVEQLGLLAQS